MSFWRDEVIQPALDEMTLQRIAEQRAWIEKEPTNPRPWYQLALLYRIRGRQEEAVGLLLEAVRLDPGFAAAHVCLAEIYAVRSDYPAAWRHARLAESAGNPDAVQMMARHGAPEGSE